MRIDLTPTQQRLLLECVQHYRRHSAGRLGFLRREGFIASRADWPTYRECLARLIRQENLNGALAVLYHLLKQVMDIADAERDY
jgi:hypothetical protein